MIIFECYSVVVEIWGFFVRYFVFICNMDMWVLNSREGKFIKRSRVILDVFFLIVVDIMDGVRFNKVEFYFFFWFGVICVSDCSFIRNVFWGNFCVYFIVDNRGWWVGDFWRDEKIL